MPDRTSLICVGLLMLTGAASTRGDELAVLPEKIDDGPPEEMMHRHFLKHAEQAWKRWQNEYEELETPEQIAAYQKRRRDYFVDAIGGFPARTPLNVRVAGVVRREGFCVEKIIFESQPKHFVTAAVFLPDPARHKPPYPGVIVPCGHSAVGKGCDAYQRASALLALNGIVALIFDPIEQGERFQLLDAKGKPRLGGTKAHTMSGIASILLGRNTARFEIWDGMRAIDVLQARPEVDPKRIGCTGNSGGGTQTSYIMALDDRVAAAAPSCYLMNLPTIIRTIGPQDAEQNNYGQLAFGMDHADYVMMRAPTPILMCTATKDFFDIGATWTSYRYAKRLYSRMGFAEYVDLIEHDAKHGFAQPLREGAVRWMMRWLLGKDEPITEPAIKILDNKEIRCTPRGQVMLLAGARSVYDLNEDYEKELAEGRRKAWATGDRAKRLDQVRQLAGVRKPADLPKPKVQKVGTVKRSGYQIDKLIIKPEEGIHLPALLFVPGKAKAGPTVLYLHEKGKAAEANPGGAIEALVKGGRTVLGVDVRGTGETQQSSKKHFGAAIGLDWQDVYAAYLLGRSYVGMRTEDILVCARYAAERTSGGKAGRVRLIAVGNVGVPALHAAALAPELFESVKLTRTLTSWSNVIRTRPTHNQLINAVHGALKVYDLPDLASTLGDKLTIDQPADALGRPIAAGG